MRKYRLLDLFCGAGGAAMGYYRAGFEVVGVDIKPQPHYPFEFHQADALTYPLDGYDVIHASPPCQEYSTSFNTMSKFSKHRYPKLLSLCRTLLIKSKKPYIIENVMGAKLTNKLKEGLNGNVLCGTFWGKQYHRHRIFETSFFWLTPGICGGRVVPGYGTGIKNSTMTLCHNSRVIIDAAAYEFEIDWMHRRELTEAIPPTYTEWIGKQLIKYLDKKAEFQEVR